MYANCPIFWLSSLQTESAKFKNIISPASKWLLGQIILPPRTKQIALKYHHFRSHIKSGHVDIHYRPTDEQLAYLLTKPLSNEVFFVLRYMLCGWGYGSKTWTCWFYWYSPFQHNGIFYPNFNFLIFGVIFPSTIVTNCCSQVRWICRHEGVWEYTGFGSMNLGR